jgi:hypothetical protein
LSDNAIIPPTLGALATWTELEATAGLVMAAAIRNDSKEADALRRRAHDILDHHLDCKIATIAAIRERVRKQNDSI